jgi:hypothetical protein
MLILPSLDFISADMPLHFSLIVAPPFSSTTMADSATITMEESLLLRESDRGVHFLQCKKPHLHQIIIVVGILQRMNTFVTMQSRTRVDFWSLAVTTEMMN